MLILGLSTTAVLAQAPQGNPQQQQVHAPGKGNAKISGMVVDADTKQPIEFALNPFDQEQEQAL